MRKYVRLTRQRGTYAERCVEKLGISMADHESFRLSDMYCDDHKERKFHSRIVSQDYD
jgi:hypothetical protein